MPTLTVPPPASSPPRSRRRLLEQFLNAYWLRPENAFWMALRSEALATVPAKSSFADLCCGDGIFTFLHFAGRLAPSFDVFLATRDVAVGAARRADMFDAVADDYRPPIEQAPSLRVDLGSDMKSTLLAKAKRLELYARLLEHDHNKSLPLPDDAFQTVYCNAAYWIRDIDGFLKELHRIVTPGGRAILHVKLSAIRNCTLHRYQSSLGRRLIEIISADRMESWCSLATQSEWESRFRRAGLDVVSTTPFVTSSHARIWDIGLRPIAPLLVKLANGVTPETRAAVKKEWVALMLDVVEPLCDPSFNLFPGIPEPVELQYVLSR